MNPTFSRYDATKNEIDVLLEGRVVGHIKMNAWGFQYVPKSVSNQALGVVYPTLAKCKASLEVD
jgi:hypothetical protein